MKTTPATLSDFVSAYLAAALYTSHDEEYFSRKAATAAGYTVHGEETPPGGPVKWVYVAPGENGAEFVHEFDYEHEAWRAAAKDCGAHGCSDAALDRDFSAEDFAPEALARAVADCLRFQNENAVTLAAAIESGGVKCGPDFDEWGRAGHDFWMTRNGHGCGFWDGDWPEFAGDALADAARAFGGVSLFVNESGQIAFDL